MKLFFKKLLIFIVVASTMEIDATNIATQYSNKYDCVNARSINTTKVNKSERKFKSKLKHGYKMGDSIRVERSPKYWIVNDSINVRKNKFFKY